MPKGDGKTIEQRILERYKLDKKTGCWNWTAGKNDCGYGFIWVGPNRKDSSQPAFKVLYELKHGPTPKRFELDHKCRNRTCINPAHIRVVTRRVNAMNSDINPAAINARKTRCPKGHPYSGQNVSINKKGSRYCKTCAREHMRGKRATHALQ